MVDIEAGFVRCISYQINRDWDGTHPDPVYETSPLHPGAVIMPRSSGDFFTRNGYYSICENVACCAVCGVYDDYITAQEG